MWFACLVRIFLSLLVRPPFGPNDKEAQVIAGLRNMVTSHAGSQYENLLDLTFCFEMGSLAPACASIDAHNHFIA
jgi:hypothetical protein